jgi:hypothetical protein
MPDGRGARIALEAGFLFVVATVLGVARVEPVWIVLVMLVAWVIVALLEWAAWREEPHWGSGQPPRYYVPEQVLPPRPPTQELPAFSLYPQPPSPTLLRDDAPTRIATPELRQELLGWPAATPAEDKPPELPQELLVEAAVVASEPEENGWEPGWPVVHDPETDPWLVEELPAVVEPEPVEPEPEQEAVAVVPELAPEPAPEPEPAQAVAPAAELPPRELRLARHRFDPFAEESSRRRPWQRRGDDLPADAELPSLPRHMRLLVHEKDGTAR